MVRKEARRLIMSLLEMQTDRPAFWGLTPRWLGDDAAELLIGLRERLGAQFFADHGKTVPLSVLRRAMAEAESLALLTPFPHLFLPALAEEKVAAARQWVDRQQEILERTAVVLSE